MMSYTCREEQDGKIIDEQVFECTSAADAATIYWGRRIKSNPEWQYQDHVILVSYEGGSVSFGWHASPRTGEVQSETPKSTAPPTKSGWYVIDISTSNHNPGFFEVRVLSDRTLILLAGVEVAWGTDGEIYRILGGEVYRTGCVLNYAGPYDPASFLSLEGVRK